MSILSEPDSSTGPRVLVVEDNPKVASLLVRAFAEEGYEVEQVGDGIQALERAATAPYDVVILDRMLPGLDGLEVCRQLRARKVEVPILMLTARTEVPERIAGLDAGADDYLPKPFALGELLARARALVRRSSSGPATMHCGPFHFHFGEMRVFLDGSRIDLTRREFTLLAYLARHAGRAVPRAELLAEVWEISFEPGTNLVEVHMRRLREKLGRHGGLVETVRGVGYRLAVLP